MNLVRGSLLAFVLLWLAACSSGEKKTRIAVIPKGTTHIYWRSIHAGAAKAAKESGVEIIWQGPQQEGDRQRQIEIVQNQISQGVDAIVLAPLDSRSLVPSVSTARKRNIPVVIIDSSLESEEYESFIATDNHKGGYLCAKRLSELLGGKGKVLMLRYMEGSASTEQRERGFLDGMAEFGGEIELLPHDQFSGATMEKALSVSQNLLNRYPEIDGIFCPNESSTQGMLRALQTAGKAGQVKFVGFDVNDALLEGLKNRQIHGLALQDPFHMGYIGVLTAVQVLGKQPAERRIDTGVRMLTLDNIQDPEIQALANPELDKWLQ